MWDWAYNFFRDTYFIDYSVGQFQLDRYWVVFYVKNFWFAVMNKEIEILSIKNIFDLSKLEMK